MTYIDAYQKRLAKALNSERMARILCTLCKRPVGSSLWSEKLYQFFGLSHHFQECVVGTLLSQTEKVYNSPVETNKRIQTQTRVKNMCRVNLQEGESRYDLEIVGLKTKSRSFDFSFFETMYDTKRRIMKDLLEDSINKAFILTKGYLEVVDILNGPKADWCSYLQTVGFTFCLSILGQMEKYYKYQTATLCALALGNHPDVKPECCRGLRKGDLLPFCKRTNHWIRTRCIKRRSLNDIKIAFSLYNVKEISPPADSRFIEESMNKNLRALTTERQDLKDLIRMAIQVERTVDEIFFKSQRKSVDFSTARSAADQRNKDIRSKGVRYDEKRRKIPSLAACYENTRAGGGSLGELLKRANLDDDPLRPPQFLGMVSMVQRFSQPVAVYGRLDEEELESVLKPSLDGCGGRVKVRRVPILEAFKVRIISKGPAVEYQNAQNFQPMLWEMLQLFPEFELTGKPVTTADIDSILDWARKQRVYVELCSGDYSAATDNLHPFLCATAIERICKRFKVPHDQALNLSNCLIRHKIDIGDEEQYKLNRSHCVSEDNWEEFLGALRSQRKDNSGDADDGTDRFSDQLWGQLMGSPVSFPVLCIVNAAVTRRSMEKAFGYKIDLGEGSFRVNGDDVLFPIPPSGYQTWVDDVTKAGLEPSIGKNYLSRQYGIINSKIFDCRGFDYHNFGGSTEVPLIKMHLINQAVSTSCVGSDKCGVAGESLKNGKSLADRFWFAINGWDGETRERILDLAYFRNKSLLRSLPPVSWYLPKALGGLGLPMRKGDKVSELHLKIAAMISCTDKCRADLVSLKWMKEPGKVFTDITNTEIANVHKQLGNRYVLRTNSAKEGFFGELLKSNLGYGVDDVIGDSDEILKNWNEMYKRWVQRVGKIKWAKDTAHETKGLHPMVLERALEYGDKFWTRECDVTGFSTQRYRVAGNIHGSDGNITDLLVSNDTSLWYNNLYRENQVRVIGEASQCDVRDYWL